MALDDTESRNDEAADPPKGVGPEDEKTLSSGATHAGPREPSARSAGSVRHRALISVFLVVTVAAVLVQNMPDSVIKNSLMGADQVYLNLTGLDQSWSIFSPNPRQQTVYVLARVEHSDGSVAVHPIPTGIGLSAYWGYRWQKYEESLSDPVGGRALWRPYAEWVVNQDQQQGGKPVRVTLVRRASDNLPPGRQPDSLPFVDQDLYTAPVTPR